jgi:hypothetical protein
MSTITTINEGDSITSSRSDINQNFANLNADKIENSVLDTDTTLSNNSDSKIATQAAVKAYVDAGGNVNASDTNKGIVEIATQAEIDAGTTTGGSGALLVVPSDKVYPTAKTLIPGANGLFDGAIAVATNVTTNTTAYLGQVIVPFKIVVNKISIRVAAVATTGTLDISMYTEDGQTQLFSVTTATLNSGGGDDNTISTTAVSAVTLVPGIYYVMINPNSTANIITYFWSATTNPFGTTAGLLGDITSEPVMRGTLTITADTPPTTFDPAAITDTVSSTPIVRLDN